MSRRYVRRPRSRRGWNQNLAWLALLPVLLPIGCIAAFGLPSRPLGDRQFQVHAELQAAKTTESNPSVEQAPENHGSTVAAGQPSPPPAPTSQLAATPAAKPSTPQTPVDRYVPPSVAAASPPSNSGSHAANDYPKTVHVNGFTKKDGTYVQPHERSAPHPKR